MNISSIISENFSGCIMISNNHSTIYEDVFGYADIPNKIKNQLNTRFATASAGKVFDVVLQEGETCGAMYATKDDILKMCEDETLVPFLYLDDFFERVERL